jgi:SAM-dependent methyltransferase
MADVAPTNEEAVEAWNGVLFDRFVQYRHLVSAGLGAHGEEALRVHPPQPGERALDIGCGFGDTTLRIAGMVGPEGSVLGFDAAERFVDLAREEAEAAGTANARYAVGDLQVAEFEERFDYAFSRMGTMFFANPVPAMRNVRRALVPGGRLCMVVWRRKVENEWVRRPEQGWRGSSRSRRSPTSRPAARGRSRWATPTSPARSCSAPASRTSRCAVATARSRPAATSTKRSRSRWRSARPAR